MLKRVLFLVVALLGAESGWTAIPAEFSSNYAPAGDPRLTFADPHVLVHEGVYYAYGTHASNGIAVAVSTDLKTWRTGLGRSKDALALHADDSFGEKNFWAPEVHRRKDGRFVMLYSAELQTCTAVSDSPLGPFVQPERRPLFPKDFGRTIDNTLAWGDDGKPRMFFSAMKTGCEEIWSVEMADDLLSVRPETAACALCPDVAWEQIDGRIIEGASVIKVGGLWYMLYSGSNCRSPDYAVGFATAPTVDGPWTKPADAKPFLRRVGGLFGTGHGAPFCGADGVWRYVFHAHCAERQFAPRGTHVVEIGFGAADRPCVTANPGTLVSCERQRREVRFGSAFSDGMVLQREKPVPIWGTAEPGTKVAVEFAGQSVTTSADADGRWRVTLSPLAASCDGRDLVVSTPNQTISQSPNRTILHDVLVGEVWLCSGQSNMNLPLWGEPRVERHANQAMDCGYLESMMANAPLIRSCQVPCVWRLEPRDLDRPLEWKRFSPGAQLQFAALPFHFATILHHALGGVPVGVINASWGDTKCEGFIPASGYASVPELADLAVRPVDCVGLPGYGGRMCPNYQPRSVWNGMLYPLAPMAIRGALWYQGEANRYDTRYRKLLQALWNGWAKEFDCPDLPFYVVQLAPYGRGGSPDDPESSSCGIWEEQAAFVRDNPHAALVATVDGGDNLNIHPSGKRRIALRLAAIALNRLYGRKDIRCEAPTLDRAVAEKDGKVRLSFSNVTNWCMFGSCDAPFELAGEDGRFVMAVSEFIQGKGEIVLSAEGVSAPVSVRYMWNVCRKGRLENEYGFLLAPFRMKLNEE